MMEAIIKINGLDQRLSTKFTNFCLGQLNIRPNILEIEGQDFLQHDRTGMCFDMDIGHYMILIKTHNRNLTQIYTTFAHELVHVKQYMYDNLGYLLDSHKPPYNERWWEKEANSKAAELILKFVQING